MIKLQAESEKLSDYLGEIEPYIVYQTPMIQQKINEIQSVANDAKERARIAFDFVRDEIAHSFDTQSPVVTISANDTISKKEGICFAKSHLLATLLRGMNIPAGFCYQRVLRKDTVESGFALHGLNALYFDDTGWFRVDPRGNKPGINSEFCIEEEKLAYPIRENLGEIDYPFILTKPLPSVLKQWKILKIAGLYFLTDQKKCETDHIRNQIFELQHNKTMIFTFSMLNALL